MKTMAAMLIALALSTAAFAADTECRAPQGSFTVKVPSFSVPTGERIVGFEIDISARNVVAVDHIPQGWSLKVDVDSPTHEKVSGTPQSGAELTTVTELPALSLAPEPQPPSLARLAVEATLYTSADLKTYVRHRFQCGELISGAR